MRPLPPPKDNSTLDAVLISSAVFLFLYIILFFAHQGQGPFQ